MYNSNRNLEDGSATVVRTVCAIVFLLFVAIYVFFYQEDTLALTQHILSGGATIYSRVIGGIIITIVLALLHFTTAKVMRTKPLCIYALSCFPSLYILAMLTDFDTSSHSLHGDGGRYLCLSQPQYGGAWCISSANCSVIAVPTYVMKKAIWRGRWDVISSSLPP